MRAVEDSASYTLIEPVVEVAIPSHADRALGVFCQQAESIMNHGKAQRYHRAAPWLAKTRAAYGAAGRETQWQTYLDELMARHRCQYSLVPLLEALKR